MIADVNDETGILTTRPAAETIPMFVPSNESVLAWRPDNAISANDAMLGNASMPVARIEQSQPINAIGAKPMDAVNEIGIIETANGTMASDITEPEFSGLADITIINAPESKSIETELPNEMIIGTGNKIPAEKQSASSARINESFAQVTECMHYGLSEDELDQVDRGAVEKRINRLRMIEIADATTADGSANKGRKKKLRSVSATISQSTSGKISRWILPQWLHLDFDLNFGFLYESRID